MMASASVLFVTKLNIYFFIIPKKQEIKRPIFVYAFGVTHFVQLFINGYIYYITRMD